jgi:hypothetical protein
MAMHMSGGRIIAPVGDLDTKFSNSTAHTGSCEVLVGINVCDNFSFCGEQFSNQLHEPDFAGA